MTTIEKEEQEALIKFRARVGDILKNFNAYKCHDQWLLRWLRARELNLDKTEDMLRKFLEWRIAEKVDELKDTWTAPEYIQQNFPVQVTGFDKEGCVVAVVPFGTWNIKKAASLGHKRDLLVYVAQIFEKAMDFMEHVTMEDRYLYQFVIILDFEGFAFSRIASKDTLDIIMEILRNFEANYPETLKAGWVVNAPKIFEILFNLVKPLLSARTLSKVNIYGSNTETWRAALLKTIDADQLTSKYGGSKATWKNYKVELGYEIFPWFDTFSEKEMMSTLVPAGSKHSVPCQLSKGNSLSFNFRTDEYDIGFLLTFQEGGGKPETLFSCDKVDSHIHLQRGGILADRTGTYTLILDNSGSRFRGKNAYYGIRIRADLWPCYCDQRVVTADRPAK